ncbi:MAG: hypothetical protein KAX49_19640 [Halanaerobiales bacterium]|nr:hypothetical protein [Halanaerobiales bacterium]
MKRVVCILSLVVFLFLGSVAVFADPHAVPGTDACSISDPIVITETPAQDSNS